MSTVQLHDFDVDMGPRWNTFQLFSLNLHSFTALTKNNWKVLIRYDHVFLDPMSRTPSEEFFKGEVYDPTTATMYKVDYVRSVGSSLLRAVGFSAQTVSQQFTSLNSNTGSEFDELRKAVAEALDKSYASSCECGGPKHGTTHEFWCNKHHENFKN